MARNKTTIDEKYNAPFPTQLRNLMDTKGETQEGLAKAVGKTRQTVSQYVNGISEPGYDTLVKIADYFDVSIDYLLGRTQDPARLPCATDELGISHDVISRFKELNDNGIIRTKATTKAINLFLEDTIDSALYTMIGNFIEELNCEKTIDIHALSPKNSLHWYGYMDRFTGDTYTAGDLEIEIAHLHPDLVGRFRVIYGSGLLEHRINEICNYFRHRLVKMTKYDQFINSLDGKVQTEIQRETWQRSE